MEISCCYAKTPQWPKCAWLADACERLGHSVRRVHDPQAFADACLNSDLLLLGHKSLAGRWPNIRDALLGRNCPAVYAWFDLIATSPGDHIREQPLFVQFERMFRASDIVLVKERGLLEQYRELGINAHWCDQGCPIDLPEVDPVEPKWDLLVWGQCGPAYKDRVKAARAAHERGYRVGWACNTPPGFGEHLPWTHPNELHRLASQARCVLSCGARNSLDGYVSDSFWLACGMGATVLRRETPGLPDGPYLTWTTPDELCDWLAWVVRNPDECLKLGAQTRAWTMQNHTIEHRVRDILKLVAGIATGPNTS